MDDDRFKAELLSRLDRIQALLSLLCGVSGGLETTSPADTDSRRQNAPEQANLPSASERCLMKDEMLENYRQALQRWKAGKV